MTGGRGIVWGRWTMVIDSPTNDDAHDDAYKYQDSFLIHRRKNNIGKTIKGSDTSILLALPTLFAWFKLLLLCVTESEVRKNGVLDHIHWRSRAKSLYAIVT